MYRFRMLADVLVFVCLCVCLCLCVCVCLRELIRNRNPDQKPMRAYSNMYVSRMHVRRNYCMIWGSIPRCRVQRREQ